MPVIIQSDTVIGDVLRQWTVQEYNRHQRGLWWYIFMISTGLGLVFYGLFTNNFLFALIIILAAIILFIQSYQEPPQVIFQITELGVILGNRFYSYSRLSNFYVIYQPPEIKTLFIRPKNSLRPLIRVPLLDENPLTVRDSLKTFLEEDLEKEAEPMSDLFARRWKIH